MLGAFLTSPAMVVETLKLYGYAKNYIQNITDKIKQGIKLS
jgi:hypothetical protein